MVLHYGARLLQHELDRWAKMDPLSVPHSGYMRSPHHLYRLVGYVVVLESGAQVATLEETQTDICKHREE